MGLSCRNLETGLRSIARAASIFRYGADVPRVRQSCDGCKSQAGSIVSKCLEGRAGTSDRRAASVCIRQPHRHRRVSGASNCLRPHPEYDGVRRIGRGIAMALNTDKIDDTALALL